jgi:hypothetical protein
MPRIDYEKLCALWPINPIKGKYVIEPQYEWATSFVDGKAIVKEGNDYYFINKKNKKTSQ